MNKETCFFHSKTNGCRHGLECTKVHQNSSRGKVVVIKNIYLYPRNDPSSTLDNLEVQIHIDLVYEDWFTELSLSYGPIRRIVIASNSCAQLLGNIYIEFENEADAFKCLDKIGRRCYSGKKILAELGNCRRIEDGICNANEREVCNKGEQCNFIHIAKVSESLINELFESQDLFYSGLSGDYTLRHEEFPDHKFKDSINESNLVNERTQSESNFVNRRNLDNLSETDMSYRSYRSQQSFSSRVSSYHDTREEDKTRGNRYSNGKKERNVNTQDIHFERVRYEEERDWRSSNYHLREDSRDIKYYRRR